MGKPNISNYSKLSTLITQRYERYLPTTFDESPSLLEKVNKVIIYLNQIGELTNSVVEQWNEVMEWVLNAGLQEVVEEKLVEWLNDGRLGEVVMGAISDLTGLTEELIDKVDNNDERVTGVVALIDTVKNEMDSLEQKVNDLNMEVNVNTTTGRYWSTNTKDLRVNVNSRNLRVLTAPVTERRRLVIYGSSTAEGFYGSSGNSWWEKLNAVMSPLGWEVIQRSRSGDSTSDGIERFHSDVASYSPDVVIIAFTLGNDGMTTVMSMDNKENIKEKFKRNILRICSMARQNGIVPIIADQFPTKRYSEGFYQVAERLNKEFDSLGFPVINLKGAIDAVVTDGQPLNLAMHDELHPNDVGHQAMFRTINPSMIERVAGVEKPERPKANKGYSGVVSTTSSLAPLSFIPKTTIESFTVFFRMKATAPVVAQRTWFAVNSNGLRISNQGDGGHALDLRGGGMSNPIISNVELDDLKEHSVAISFSSISKFVKLYVDGKLIGTDSSPDLTVDEFTWANRRESGVLGHSMGFKDIAIYRARLSDQQIMDLHNGFVSMSGLDVFSPLAETTVLEGRFSNLAPTDEAIEANTNGIYTITE